MRIPRRDAHRLGQLSMARNVWSFQAGDSGGRVGHEMRIKLFTFPVVFSLHGDGRTGGF